MAYLRFTSNYIEPILAGRKVTTMRANDSIAASMKAALDRDGLIDARCRYGDPPFARLRVTAVERKPVRDLRAADALRDGFGSARELRSVLRRRYPGVTTFWLIRFRLEGTHGQEQDEGTRRTEGREEPPEREESSGA